MNAQTKVEPDTMALWNAVAKTNPANTKRVNQRGGFTAINAHSQILEATRQFGPLGIGWGYESGSFQMVGNMIVVPVTLWHGERANTFGPIYGCAEMLGQRPDHDAPKKATTDAITKGLSQLGFNADVFLGLYDDNKYVAAVTAEFAGGPPANGDHDPTPRKGKDKDAPFPPGPCKNKTELKEKGREFWREVVGCGDPDELAALLASNKELQAQIASALPIWWEGGKHESGEPFEGLGSVIAGKQSELAANAAGGDWRNNPLNGG